MRADNSHLVIAAARRRSATTRKRAVAALRRMEKPGRSITFDECCPALKMAMTPSLSMKTKMVALVATLTG